MSGAGVVQGDPGGGRVDVGAQLAFGLPIFGQVAGRVDAAEANVRVTETSIAKALWERASDIRHAMSIAELFDAYRAIWEARLEEIALQETMVNAEADLERAAAVDSFAFAPHHEPN